MDNRLTPKLTGTYNRNENRKAVSRSIPSNIEATIVAPERLIPGTNATACAKPTITASLIVISSSFLYPFKNDEEITIKDAVIVGLAPAVSLVPGISRSGATIVASMLLGMEATIVAPERLIPGTNATACAKPTITASLIVISSSFLYPFKFLMIQRAIAVINSVKPTIVTELRFELIKSSNKRPIIPVIIVATRR